MEVWKPVVGYEGLFEVSSTGRVRSLTREVLYKDGRVREHKGQLLSPWVDHHGYYRVSLKLHQVVKHKHVHRLVAEAFVHNSNISLFDTVDHINANKLDNSVENLQWLSRSANITKKAADGTAPVVRGHAKLTFELAAEIRGHYLNGKRVAWLKQAYRVSRATIYRVINNQSWEER